MRCGECGVEFHMPTVLYDECKKQGPDKSFYCPNGHRRVFREAAADKLTRERDRLKQQLAQKDDEIAEAKASAGKLERKLKRVSKGVCPCCTRSFTNLHRHMQTKHPELKADKPALKVVASK